MDETGVVVVQSHEQRLLQRDGDTMMGVVKGELRRPGKSAPHSSG